MSIEKNNTAAAVTPRRRKNPEAKAAFRDEVVAIARQLFAEEGFESVSLRTIAARAGCSPMTLYVYFPNKLAMLRFIWADIFKAVFAEMEAAMAVQPDAASKLRAYGLAWFHYWLAHPENYRVVFMNQDEGTYHAKADQDGLDQPFFADGELAMSHRRLLAGVFEEGMAKGQIRQMASFREYNLLNDLKPLGTFDVVFCRNVLIYFDQPTKTKVLEQIARVMPEDGFLFLGGAETVLGITDRFKPMDGQRGLYVINSAAAQPLAGGLKKAAG